MSGDIKLSPQHGLNTSLSKCFWCGKSKSIVIFGKMDKKDSKAPFETIIDYEPCDECLKNFEQGIRIIGCVDKEYHKGFPPISKNGNTLLYPTGSYVVVKEDSLERIFPGIENNKELMNDILDKKVMITDNSFVQELIEISKKED